MRPTNRIFKIVLLGEGNVGKTSIRRRYMGENLLQNYQMTLGADISLKRIMKDGRLYLIQIWDLGGQQVFTKIRSSYYEGALVGLLVFDISKRSSFEKLHNWIVEIQDNRGEHMHLLLIGNKVDLREEKDNCVSYEEAVAYAEELSTITGYEVLYYETSALDGTNIEKAFEKLVEIGDKYLQQKEDEISKSEDKKKF